jgi:pyroglutamyl-peptidase
MKILVTGFNPFGELERNPSQVVIAELTHHPGAPRPEDLVTEVLRTEYTAAGDRIRSLIHQHNPNAILMLGVSARLSEINLERVALNLDDASLADNTGMIREGQMILPEAPKAYFSTLPLEEMRAALQARSIPATISNHAGTYLCNHVFFVARHEVQTASQKIPCGFIHIPLISDDGEPTGETQKGLPLEVIVAGIESCLDVIRGEAS